MHAPVASHFATSSPEEGRALVAAAYAENQLKITGNIDTYRLVHSRADFGQVRLDRYQDTTITEYVVQPLHRLTVFRLLDRGLRLSDGRRERTAGPGDVILAAQPDRSHRARLDGVRMQVVGIDPALVAAVSDAPLDRIRRLRPEPLDPVAASQWNRTVTYVGESILDGPGSDSPLLLGAAGRMLAATLLSVFDPDYVSQQAADRAAERADGTTAAVRRATAYIETNPDLDMSVADIARAAHLSVRAVQLAFRRQLDTTPLGYLRRVRLDLAHRDLIDAVPGDGDTVTRIAARWGYARPSRFAADYRAAYGVHPHQTLRAVGG